MLYSINAKDIVDITFRLCIIVSQQHGKRGNNQTGNVGERIMLKDNEIFRFVSSEQHVFSAESMKTALSMGGHVTLKQAHAIADNLMFIKGILYLSITKVNGNMYVTYHKHSPYANEVRAWAFKVGRNCKPTKPSIIN